MAQFQKFMFDNFVIDCDKEDVVVEPEVEAEPEVVVVEAEPVEENIVSEPEIVAEPEIVVEPVVSYSQEEMDDAVRKAEETGYERGFRQAESEAEQRQEALMNEMNGKLSMMLADMATENSERENEAVQMALALVKKLKTVNFENLNEVLNFHNNKIKNLGFQLSSRIKELNLENKYFY